MSKILPDPLVSVIDSLGKISGVGSRTAERYAYFLLKSNPEVSRSIAENLLDLHKNIKKCPKTFALISSNEEFSSLYMDTSRNKKVVAVVEEPLDIVAFEKTKQFNGTYHVLGGVISPINGVGPDDLTISSLKNRIIDDEVEEVIIATNASVEGESTAIYIQKILKESGFNDLIISRIARGLPAGLDLEYADQITLSHALEGRRRI